ncbi:MAG: hypothetical protein PHS98_04550 [Bacilli bacterium]|nr:hypothetical protein [Bacilli bacterium]
MKTRMERYFSSHEVISRTKKNKDIYENIYDNLPSSSVAVLDNESEIDISKLEELTESREGYKKIKQYRSIVKNSDIEDDDEEYDIYEDIDNKIYDINMILEDAKSRRKIPEREKYRNLRNTQYNILSKLNLDEEPEEDEMATDFFTQENTINDLVTSITTKVDDNVKTSSDLFDNLRGGDNTVLTEPVKDTGKYESNTYDNDFYTSGLSFTKEDFEGFQNLQTTVKKNNRLIKVLITVLTIVLVAIVAFLAFTLL